MMLILAIAMLAGCDYTTPLLKKPDRGIDESLLGLWKKTGGGEHAETLLVLPLGEREYMISYPLNTENALFARACLSQAAGITLVQMNWFGTSKGVVPNDNRTFQFVSYKIEEDLLTIQLLNPDIVAKDIDTPDALAKSIIENKVNPELFRDKMIFRKVATQE